MKLSLSLPLLLLLSIPLMASQGHVYRDSEGAISVYRIEPNAQIQVGIDTPPNRNLTANRCGLLVVTTAANYPRATIQVDGETIDPATLPTQIRPSCRPRADGSHALDEPRTQHFVTEGGDLVVVGKTPDTRYAVTYPGQLRILNRNVNACGFLRVRETQTINFNQSILLPTTNASTYAEFQVSQIPETRPLLCYRGNLYYPQPWVDIFATAIPGTEVAAAVVQTARSIPSAIAGAGGGGSGSGGGGSSGGGSGGSSGGSSSGSGSGAAGDSSGDDGAGGGSSGGSSDSGDTGGTGADAGDSGGSGDAGGGSVIGVGPMYTFSLATYDPRIHDFNGDGLVDDATGNGIPDDRDGDGHPDGPWKPNDMPRSAGPGLTVPVNVSICLGFDGSIVAASSGFVRNAIYGLSADDGVEEISRDDDPIPSPASRGSLAGPPVVLWEGDWRPPNFSYGFEGSSRYGYLYREGSWDWNEILSFRFSSLDYCITPPWLTSPPPWLQP